ncbi:MAG: low molecular weight protein-tyrosine-phosphatase [Actinomycetota bacterium]|nr:low molecular weight protein-tyrosine-phosphatase [Actinomycetota bacterium]
MSLRVLTVCAGNICRSPAAAAAIAEEAAIAGLDVVVDSAGTGAWNVGDSPHPRAVAAGERAGLDIEGRARRVNKLDFERFDVILAMDRANYRDLMDMTPSLEGRAKIRLFRTYDHATEEDEVPDPYGGPDSGYDETITQVRSAAAGFVESLVSASVEDAVTLE